MSLSPHSNIQLFSKILGKSMVQGTCITWKQSDWLAFLITRHFFNQLCNCSGINKYLFLLCYSLILLAIPWAIRSNFPPRSTSLRFLMYFRKPSLLLMKFASPATVFPLVPLKNPLAAFVPIGENLLCGLIAVKHSQERHALDGYSLLITILSSLESNQLKNIHLFCIAGFTLHSNILHPAYRSYLYLTF